ncbi:hypothetical protein [Calothrix sp. PCC 6303]
MTYASTICHYNRNVVQESNTRVSDITLREAAARRRADHNDAKS